MFAWLTSQYRGSINHEDSVSCSFAGMQRRQAGDVEQGNRAGNTAQSRANSKGCSAGNRIGKKGENAGKKASHKVTA